MKIISEKVERIKKHYVGDECIQVMFPYDDVLTILNQDGILFYNDLSSDKYINKYIYDERRKQFPYSNIPTHYEKKKLGKKIAYTNQLIDYEKPYIRIGNGYILENYAIKDSDQVLLVTKKLNSTIHIEHMTYEELMGLFMNKPINKEQVYYLSTSGNIISNDILSPERKIKSQIIEESLDTIYELEKALRYDNYALNMQLHKNPWFLEYLKQHMQDMDFSLVDFNIKLCDCILIVKIQNGNINIQGIEVKFIKENDYKVSIYDIPTTKYTLEQIKYAIKINEQQEPKISLKLNPGVTKTDIETAKQLIKKHY